MVLTPSQEQLLLSLPAWWRGKQQVGILEGAAGYGKTFMVKQFLQLMGKRVKPLILAETNEAVNVLRQGLGSNYLTKTVCSAFNLSVGNIDGVKQLVQYNEPDFKEVNLIIVDECSMLGKERLVMILRTASSLGIKVLLIGHSSQLPPVESRNDEHGCLSPAFDFSFYEDYNLELPQQFYLHEPVRNTTEIFEFCTEVESLLRKRGVIPYKFVVGSSFLASYLKPQEGIASFLQGKTVALAYSNKRVAEINQTVRFGIFGKLASEEYFIVTDRVIFRQPTFCFWVKLKEGVRSVEEVLKAKKTVFTTNTKAVVTSITFKTLLGIDCWELKVESNHYEEGKQVGYCYYPLNREDVVAYFHKLHNFAVWDKNPVTSQKKHDLAYAVGSIFGVDSRDEKHDLRHSYAITVDCSQGATIDNVIVDEADIDRCVRNRTLLIKVKYVAFSRAKVNLWRIQ